MKQLHATFSIEDKMRLTILGVVHEHPNIRLRIYGSVLQYSFEPYDFWSTLPSSTHFEALGTNYDTDEAWAEARAHIR